MLMKDPLLRSVEYEKEMYAAPVQRKFAVKPKNAPAAMGNHSCAELETVAFFSASSSQNGAKTRDD